MSERKSNAIHFNPEASFQHKCERSCDDFVVPSGSCGSACDCSLNFEKVIGLKRDFNTC